MSKRPIDAHRDAAISMGVGTAAEGALGEIFATEEALYITKPNAIYKIQLADQIDPRRQNLGVPNTQQKVYSIGYNSELVCRTVLTVDALVTDARFGEVLSKAAVASSLRVLDSLISMRGIERDFIAAEDGALSELDATRRKGSSVAIPAVGDIGGRVKRFVQNAEHCCQDLFRIGCLFYQVEKNWIDGLFASVKEKHGGLIDEDLNSFDGLITFMKFVRNARHCVEHPKPDQRLESLDFRVNSDAQFVPPTVEIVHPQTPEPAVSVRFFFQSINESLLNVAESFVAHICAFHAKTFSGFPIQVMLIPEERRQAKLIRYGYAICLNGTWQILG